MELGSERWSVVTRVELGSERCELMNEVRKRRKGSSVGNTVISLESIEEPCVTSVI